MTSNEVKHVFAAAGIKVRVADLKYKFRICTTNGADFERDKAQAVAAQLGLTDSLRVVGGQFNQGHELVGYKPARTH